jgi:hypothetical protein
MRQSIIALGIAFLLGSASLAFAAPQTWTGMKQSLRQQGYSQVHNFNVMGEGTSVQAMKDGQNWTLILSPEGQIVGREAVKGGGPAGTP